MYYVSTYNIWFIFVAIYHSYVGQHWGLGKTEYISKPSKGSPGRNLGFRFHNPPVEYW